MIAIQSCGAFSHGPEGYLKGKKDIEPWLRWRHGKQLLEIAYHPDYILVLLKNGEEAYSQTYQTHPVVIWREVKRKGV